jgi:nucleotidyltransferase/DNA polymerase involved in DNA repair
MAREILYAEVPGFYAAVERADDPRLASRPVVVGGDPRKRGRVQAATPDALAAGVSLDMPVLEALQRCPGARAVPTDMRRYREVDRRFVATLRRVVARIESFGLGAGFADLGGSTVPGEEIAEAMRRAVREALSLPLRVGLASGKFLARLAAQELADEGVLRIAAGDEDRFLAPLPVARLEGVGRKTAATLAELGAHTIADVVALGRDRLHAALGVHGLRIYALATGRDEEPVQGARHPKSVSRESRVQGDGIDFGALSEQVAGLTHQLELELARNGVAASRIAVKLRDVGGAVVTRTRTLAAPVASATALREEALALFTLAGMGARAVRGIGIQLTALVPATEGDRQLPLFPGG